MSDTLLSAVPTVDVPVPGSDTTLPDATGQPSVMKPFACLYPAPEQVRTVTVSAEQDNELDASILVHGLINPLTAYQDAENAEQFAVFAGGRRLR